MIQTELSDNYKWLIKSFQTLVNRFTSLTQNTSSTNQQLAAQLINDKHRYLIQKYFDNERSFTVKTVGAMPLTITATPAVGDVTATLAGAWNYLTCQQFVTFGDGEQRLVSFINGATAISWISALNGGQFLLTSSIAAGATTATLSSAWPNSTVTQTSAFSDGSTKSVTFTSGSTAISWTGGLSNAQSAYVRTFAASSSTVSLTTITTVGVQNYPLPANISKIKDFTVSVGQLVYTPNEVKTRYDWDQLNALPYTSDIPNNYYIYGSNDGPTLGIWPIPSSTGNIVTFNYKTRIPDLNYFDFSVGFIATNGATKGSTAVTGSGTNWTGFTTTFSNTPATGDTSGTLTQVWAGVSTIQLFVFSNTDQRYVTLTQGSNSVTWSTPLTAAATTTANVFGFPSAIDVTSSNLFLQIPAPRGDGLWYQIQTFNSTTSITLVEPIVNDQKLSGTNSGLYVIGQIPLLSEDFHDMICDGALMIYFSTIVPDKNKYEQFARLYNEKLELLSEYAGVKALNVDLGSGNYLQNPNLFIYSNGN